MYQNQRILALIPARGGSKGIKDKNIINLNGAPLISYSIKEALKSKYIDETIISTDSERIAEVAKSLGGRIPFMRPDELATDQAKTIDVVLHAIKELESRGEYYDVLVLLQPTQPLRTAIDIDDAIEYFFEKNEKGLVSVSLVDDHPILIRTLAKDGTLTSLLSENSTCRRQDMQRYYKVNGCIYINQVRELTKETSLNDNPIGYIMEPSHSVDIDESKDLYLAEYYLTHREE